MGPLRVARASFAILGIAAVVSLAACTTTTPSPAPSTPSAVPATMETLPGIWITGDEVKSPDTPYLALYQDGSWQGSDGCNGVEGTWSVDAAGLLRTTAGPHTLIFCEGQALPTALVNARAAVFAGEQLRLIDEDGSTLYTLKQTDQRPRQVRGTADVVGWWGSKDTSSPRQIYLELTGDGKMTGNDGCNTFGGTWKFSDEGSVALSPIATTLKECPGFTPWLSKAESALVDGRVLVITNDIGSELGVLQRSALLPTPTPTPPIKPSAGSR